MRVLRLWAACFALTLCSLPSACSSTFGRSRNNERAAEPQARAIAIEELDERPPLALLTRHGDPYPALAVAVTHDLGADASLALSTLVLERLSRSGLKQAQARVHALGFQIHVLVRSARQAADFVRAASAALSSEVEATDRSLRAVNAELARRRTEPARSAAERALSACSGELSGSARVVRASVSASELEEWRRRVHATRAAAFAALGPERVLESAAAAVRQLPAWPDGDGPEDEWPAADVTGTTAVDGDRLLSVALRLPGAPAAAAAARSLGHDHADLSLRLSALDPAWSLDRVVATVRPRGACLRVDLRPPKGDPAPRVADVARAAAIAASELDRALKAPERASGWSLDQAVLNATDPREAAAILAWQTLSGRLEPGSTRRVVNYYAEPQELKSVSDAALSAELRRLAERTSNSALEVRERIEAGQGELWLLVASPCGTRSESDTDAGLSATVAYALAARAAHGDVTIEPWVTPDGVGLLAHAPQRDARESPIAHAERVASALGRALVTARLSAQEAAHARHELLQELGSEPRPAYWFALDILSGRRPSWFEARGSFGALSEAAALDVEAARRVLASGPLRVAILANSSQQQVKTAVGTLEHWIGPVRAGQSACPAVPEAYPRRGEFSVDAAAETSSAPRAYVAVRLPAAARREALLTQVLLTRPGGWLEQALQVPGLASRARARLLRGARAGALVIEIDAFEGRAKEAVAQVRGLLERLSEGVTTQLDLALAQRLLAGAELAATLDPRHRIVELWRGTAAEPAPTLASLRRFHEQVFSPEAHVVVYLKARE